MSYPDDRRWSEQFIGPLSAIIRMHIPIEQAADELDCFHATDLVFRLSHLRVACRVRRYKYFHKYRHQVTIRYRRTSGTKTEWEKIGSGAADWLIYAFASPNDKPPLYAWKLIDLEMLRISRPEFQLQDNYDGTEFAWSDSRTWPNGIIIAARGPSQNGLPAVPY